MLDKGKGRRVVWHLPKALGRFSNSLQEDGGRTTVQIGSSHCVSKASPRLPIKRDFRKHCEILRYSPYKKPDPLSHRNLKKDDQDTSRCSSNKGRRVMRDEVEKILRLYREILDKLLRENNKLIGRMPNIHQNAAYLLQNSINFLHRERRIGAVTGVEIGDEFQCRAELVIVGLHLQFGKGIDYMVNGSTTLATSVTESNRYENTVNSCGELIYTGEGGNPMVTSYSRPKDQVLKYGNLALKNSMDRKTPVRVIRKHTFQDKSSYVYDGLHMVVKYWRERGRFNKIVFKFQFRRISGQAINPRGFPFKSSKYLLDKKSVIMEDLSRGKEVVAISVVNTIDDERPSGFTYTKNETFGIESIDNSQKIGCDCGDGGCSDSEEECSCKVKNGRKFRYDYGECLEKKIPFIYECGPSCKCFDSCTNKVGQRGIRLKLEVYKTESKGWGVRSKTHIPCGKFVCEYVGEIVKLKEIDKKVMGDNEYLFILGNNKNDTQFGDLSCFEENEVLAINAANEGNVGRFINHSCSPNLHVQNVYIGPQSKAPHIMLFAMRDIKPFEELTFNYKFRLGCKNWNTKVNICKCGSSNCVGKFS